MKKQGVWVLILSMMPALFATEACAVTVSQGTAFTYQGQLSANGAPSGGQTYQFTFTLYDAASTGNAVGSPIQQSILVGAGGLFTTDLDFGQIFNGAQYWLEIKVGTTIGNEQPLAARQPINTVPVAQYALNTPPETFAEFYHTNDGSGVNVAVGGAIPFPVVGLSSGSSIIAIAQPPDFVVNQFLVTTSGIYEVSFELSTEDAGGNTLAFTVNDVVVPHAQTNQETKTQVGKFLIQMNAGDVLSLFNKGASTLHLGAIAIGATDANLVIKKLHTL